MNSLPQAIIAGTGASAALVTTERDIPSIACRQSLQLREARSVLHRDRTGDAANRNADELGAIERR
jgi:hypothetical protein